MGIQPMTIRDANAANRCADAFAGRGKLFRSVAAFATLVLLLCAPMLRAQGTTPVLGTGPATASRSPSTPTTRPARLTTSC